MLSTFLGIEKNLVSSGLHSLSEGQRQQPIASWVMDALKTNRFICLANTVGPTIDSANHIFGTLALGPFSL